MKGDVYYIIAGRLIGLVLGLIIAIVIWFY